MKDLITPILQVVIILGIVLAFILYFTKKDNNIPVMYDSNYVKLIESKAKLEERINQLEIENLSLKDENFILQNKEVKIINNNTTYKNKYKELTPNETDRIFQNIFK